MVIVILPFHRVSVTNTSNVHWVLLKPWLPELETLDVCCWNSNVALDSHLPLPIFILCGDTGRIWTCYISPPPQADSLLLCWLQFTHHPSLLISQHLPHHPHLMPLTQSVKSIIQEPTYVRRVTHESSLEHTVCPSSPLSFAANSNVFFLPTSINVC